MSWSFLLITGDVIGTPFGGAITIAGSQNLFDMNLIGIKFSDIIEMVR